MMLTKIPFKIRKTFESGDTLNANNDAIPQRSPFYCLLREINLHTKTQKKLFWPFRLGALFRFLSHKKLRT